ncbi:MAG: hypothetical protein ACOX0Z_02440 [Candidatus Nanosyncoccaceae bacterium]|jgi:hypothetical protein
MKHLKCPRCGNDSVAWILYGEPVFNERLEKELANGKVAIGGCLINPKNPKWKCNNCKHEFTPKKKSKKSIDIVI